MNKLHAIIGTVCLVCFLYQCYSVLEVYLEYNFSVTMDERQRNDYIVFPAVTVCVDGWLSTEKLCKYRPNKCHKHDMMEAPGLYIVQSMPVLRNATTFPAQELFSCVMTAGGARCPAYNCSDRIQSTYYRLPSQLCFTFDVNAIPREEHPFQDCPSQWDWELELRYRFSKRDTMLFLPKWVYPLFVHQTGISPPDQLSAVQLLPGKVIHVTVKQLRTFRLPAPYKSMCTDYRALGTFPEFKGMLNYDICMQKCAMELEVIHCGCVQVTHEFTASYPAATCDFTASGSCFAALTANGTYAKCKRSCGLPCEQIHYDVRITEISNEQGPTRKTRESFTLKLRFRSDIEELVLYQPTLTRIEFIAYAAGYLGIWLGLSVMTFLLDMLGMMRTPKRAIEEAFGDIWTKKDLRLRLKNRERWTDRVIDIR
ncbi:uncharacterized protein [Dermacentor andersoni]|uniref:uncharacterized protein n=1 Tax=Dermacentor andersoni TaxID=34620 RepID=UPI003B3B2C82